MQLKRKKVTLKEEQKIVINMITSTEYLQQTRNIIKSYLLKSSYTKIVASWCLEYFDNMKQAPGRDIQDIYIRKRKELVDEEEVELVREFLQNLSNQWEELQAHNINYEVKNTVKYFRLQQATHLIKQVEAAVAEGNEDQAELFIANYQKVEYKINVGVDLLHDDKKVIKAFDEKEEVLFRLQGDLGKAIGNLCRGDFLAILGGPKSGKSFAQWNIGHRAALMGLKVIILNFEMSENQYVRRAWQSLQGLPKESKKIKIPYFEEDPQGDGFYVKYRTEDRKGIDLSCTKDIQKKYRRAMKGGSIRIESFISGQTTFSEAVARLQNLEYYHNFIPDVIIWDYPDIMLHEGRGENRHLIDNTWKKIRGYAQDKNCLCVAASQVVANKWGKDIKGGDAEENKKKANHVTKMIALNSTEEEAENGIVRMQVLYERDSKRVYDQVCILQCLEIGRFYIDSKFRKNVILDDD